jgi:hypothetical protein
VECRKVISLGSPRHFTWGEWTTFAKPLPDDEGWKPYFCARPGFELTLWVDSDDFIFRALARTSEGGKVEESGFRMTPIVDPDRLNSLLEGRCTIAGRLRRRVNLDSRPKGRFPS